MCYTWIIDTGVPSEVRIPRIAKRGASDAPTARKGRGERMLHIRLDADLHRALRLIVAAQDTTLQEWVVRTLAAAARASGAQERPGGPGGNDG
jgi:hypothetical protein